MNTTGIYEIVNKVNGRKYVGSGNLSARKYDHWRLLRKGCHFNPHLQNAWNKYGEENFEFKIVCFCDKDLLQLETKYIQSNVDGYNIAQDAIAPRLGIKASENTRIKQSTSMRKAWKENKLVNEVWNTKKKNNKRCGKMYDKENDKYKVRCFWEGKMHYIATYNTEQEAIYKSEKIKKLIADGKSPLTEKTLGSRGVEKRGDKYRARIEKDGKKINLGIFDTFEEAEHIYIEAKKEIPRRTYSKKKFRAVVSRLGEKIYLGRYDTKEEADLAMDNWYKQNNC